MEYVVENVADFKALVLSGLPKMLTGVPFESDEEMGATFSFIGSHGIPFDTGHFGNFKMREELNEGEETLPTPEMQCRECAAEAVAESVRNFFSGMYGV